MSTDQHTRNFFVPVYVFSRQCTLKLITLTLTLRRAVSAPKGLLEDRPSVKGGGVRVLCGKPDPNRALLSVSRHLGSFGHQMQLGNRQPPSAKNLLPLHAPANPHSPPLLNTPPLPLLSLDWSPALRTAFLDAPPQFSILPLCALGPGGAAGLGPCMRPPPTPPPPRF